MKEDITPERIANAIRILRKTYSGTFIIVEGSTDARVYKDCVDSKKCEFSIAHNKDKAISTLAILEKENFAGVLAIVDADFSRLEGSLLASPNLLVTDYHDLEIMIIQSPVFDKVMAEFGSEGKIIEFAKDIRSSLLETGKSLGYLRWVSLKENLALKFEGLDVKDFRIFIDDKTLTVNQLEMIKKVKNNSKKYSLREKDILEKLENLKDNTHDPRQLCCGHDLIYILSIGLCKAWGTWDSREFKPEVLEKWLRVTYGELYFRSTQLYLSIQEWEKNNQPYQVLSTT
ncbi:hypothetical protein NIES4074_58220 [Cylindrospermum sp. NIES-4074]|nr:hypothetical protein NIES4074_58220 [Cylindrospermum sp. NIES-4074]